MQGIYQIRNTVNEKVYIGSSNNIFRRWRDHKNGLNNDIHKNPYLQKSWNKYGKENFVFEIMEEAKNTKDILVREQWFLDNVVRWGIDYNIAKDASCPTRGMTGEKSNWWGKKHSDETKKKMSEAQKGRTFSDETRKKMSKSAKGKTLSSLHKERIGISMKGRIFSDNTKKKMSDSNSGENGNNAKLSERDVLEIRRLWLTEKYFQTELAKIFDVGQQCISHIVNRKTWRHIS